ncbi:MAG TPA: glycosyltransferase [Spirochaetia bacterium]|nr:glycosyltransferase [Spirochaetia bacterium]
MKIVFFLPSKETVYAAKFIHDGYKNAFEDMGHKFITLTSNEDLELFLKKNRPDIFMYGLNFYHLKFLDLNILEKYRKKGMVVFCQVGSWNHLTNIFGAEALKDNKKYIQLIKNNIAGDIYWHWFEQDEPLMKGFVEGTSKKFETILLAADKTVYFPEYSKDFIYDFNYVGSFLPSKREYLKKNIFPLIKKYQIKIFGSDWTAWNRFLGIIQKFGQYFNIEPFKNVRKLMLTVDDERRLYSSSKICLNVHENHVIKHNCEINERTFKILACGGFEICDNLPIIRKYFSEKELVIAKNSKDFSKKIAYYLKHDKERKKISKAGYKKVIKFHSYHNRAQQILDLFESFKKGNYGK